MADDENACDSITAGAQTALFTTYGSDGQMSTVKMAFIKTS